jgi:glyoxylase-like metal-dependent hydrolase (beta-lactamase superfamily II)
VSVFFEEANVLHTGDTWFNGYYPFIDYDSGGSIEGMVTASSENLERADAQTLLIPGHGGIGRRTDLISFREMLQEVSGKVGDLKKKGLSLGKS